MLEKKSDIIVPKFLDPCRVELLDDIPKEGQNSRWMLLTDFRYDSYLYSARVTVQKGFVTDFASVPKQLPLAYALFSDQARRPAIVHDWGYQTHIFVTKSMTDQIFQEAMHAIGMSVIDIKLMFEGVRIGGQDAWDTGPTRFKVLNAGLRT